MKNAKRFLVLLLALAMVFALAACNNDSSNDDNSGGGEQVKAVMISVMSGGTYWGPIEQGWRETGESFGWQTDYWTPVTTNSQTEMIELTESAITQGYKILCVCGTDANMWSDVVNRAKEAGCIVIGVAADLGEEYIECCVGPDYYNMGYQGGEYMANLLNADGVEEANFFSIQTAFQGEGVGQDAQRQGYLDGLTEHFNGPVNDLGAETNDSSASVAQDKLNAVYLVHPEMNVYYGVETYAMVAGASFVEEHGLQGKFYTQAPDAEVENLQLLLDDVYKVGGSLDVYYEGAECARSAKTLLEGGTLDQHYIPVPMTLCDATNLKDYLDTFGVEESQLTWPD